jgi:HAMP domain-containing protein/signal transduction histidine kinase
MSMERTENHTEVQINESDESWSPRGLTIRSKLLLFTTGIGFLILAALAITAFFLSAVALRTARLDGFQSLRTSLSQAINTYFADQRRDISAQAELQTVRYAVTELSSGYEHLIEDLDAAGFKVDPSFLSQVRQSLRAAYESGPMANLRSLGMQVGTFDEFSDLSPVAAILQYVYILKNPANPGFKFQDNSVLDISKNQNLPPDFRSAFAKTMFARAMDRYHGLFETVVRRNSYFDLMLIDDLGNVVYTFEKGWDFGTNVFKGWRQRSQLEKVFLGAWYGSSSTGEHASSEEIVITDLERYAGASGSPMLFLSCPINNRLGGRLGVVVHKIASTTFTDMVTFQGRWSAVGLGETGEAYIVGPDMRLRTESRFAKQMPEKMKSLSFEPDGSPGPLTSVLGAPLHNTAVENIFSDQTLSNEGEVTFFDDLGRESLGVYKPLGAPGLDWGLVVTISTDEAFAPAVHLTRLIAFGGFVILIVAILAALAFGHLLSGPIVQLVNTAEKIGSGDLSARAPISSRDEIGFLAERFNYMIDQVEERNRQVHKILQTVNEGLFLMGPDFIIQPGYSKITEEIFQRKMDGIYFLDLLRPAPESALQPIVSEEILLATQHYLELLLNPRIKEQLIQQTNPLVEVEYQILQPKGAERSKFLGFRFNRVVEGGRTTQIMVTTQDLTSRISLARQIKENQTKAQSQIEMLFGIMHLDPPILGEFLNHAKSEIDGMLSLLEAEQFGSHADESSKQRSERYLRLLQKISRSIHLIKGNAAMLRLSYFEDLANQLEETIASVRNNASLAGEQFLPITTSLAVLRDQIDMTHDLIGRLLSMQKVFGKESRGDSNNDFTPLVELAQEIAERNGKQVRVNLQITDGLARLPNPLREPIQMMMTQLVRNAVLHGIEPPSERLAQRKHPVGEIQISADRMTVNQKKIILTVRDDGRGLDYDLLRRRAVQLGYGNRETIQAWTPQRLIDLLFETGFTTMDRPTTDGGRGVGLDAVRDLTAKMGGFLNVLSNQGQFCEFRLEIPIA